MVAAMEQTSHRKEDVLFFVPNLIGQILFLILISPMWLRISQKVRWVQLKHTRQTMAVNTNEQCKGLFVWPKNYKLPKWWSPFIRVTDIDATRSRHGSFLGFLCGDTKCPRACYGPKWKSSSWLFCTQSNVYLLSLKVTSVLSFY